MKSAIWNINRDELENIVKNSSTFTQILKHFSFCNIGGNSNTLKRRLKHDNIDFSHIPQGIYAGRGRSNTFKQPLDQKTVLVNQSPHSSKTARRIIIRHKLIPYQCAICGLEPMWMENVLTLILDHKDGARNNHSLENLRFVCPNCNSQLATFGGRNIKRIKRSCMACGGYISNSSRSGLCAQCRYNNNHKRIPSRDELHKMMCNIPATIIAKRYGVSGRAVAKWCERYGIKRPGIGYWSRRRSKQMPR